MERQELAATFCRQAEAMGARVLRIAGPLDLASQVVDALRPLGSRVALAASSLAKTAGLAAALERSGFHVEREGGEFASRADSGVVEFDLGIAETGTLVHDATDLKARLASMLPLTCLAVLPVERLVVNMVEALAFYTNRGSWPGYLAFVTGPSRTADIERSLTIGVHGPERLLIALVDQGGEGQ
ncbi:MAG: LutC/YkgG family protein [Syntrophothermus sp.]